MIPFLVGVSLAFGIYGYVVTFRLKRRVRRIQEVIRIHNPGMDRDAFDR